MDKNPSDAPADSDSSGSSGTADLPRAPEPMFLNPSNYVGGLIPSNLMGLVEALDGRRSGASWMARCPAHQDRNPSLSIREGRDGQILVHCHGGCAQADVIACLRARGLWPERPQRSQVIKATYDYMDEHGRLLYQVLRMEPKAFLQRRPDGAGGWVWRTGDRQVLYRLREVLEAPTVFVVEGEKDVETLREYGFVSTTNAGGAKAKWLDTYTETLRGRECVLIPDNDPVGWQRVATIGNALLGTAARICILDLPRQYKDISDWFGDGHSECELIAMLESVHAV